MSRFSFTFLPVDVDSIPVEMFRNRAQCRVDVSVQVEWTAGNQAIELIITDTLTLALLDLSWYHPVFRFRVMLASLKSSLTEYKARE